MKNSPKISNGVHFIGIGGIGVSALAKYYLKRGYRVSGSDLVSSELTRALKKEGAKIIIGRHRTENLPENCTMVIYSPAVPEDNPELRKAKRLKIKCQSYPQALGELTKKFFTIAVSGTHGKSTTTAMIGLLLAKAGLNPTVILGTKLKEFGDSNCRVGKSSYLIIEADEHFASFLNYWPKIIVLTNIEKDHLDYYKNLENTLKIYKKYIYHLPQNGILVANRDDRNINILKSKCSVPPKISSPKANKFKSPRRKAFGFQRGRQISELKFKIKNYSLKQKEAKTVRKILKIPGEHNISNALATLKVARILKIPDKISFKVLSKYKGSWRRFEVKQLAIKSKPLTLVSDYGHHPTEIKVTLKAAREKFPKKEIWCIFQPHQYQRTHYLFKDFVRVLKAAPVDKLIITDIYDVVGRESKEIKKKVNSQKLVKAINRTSVVYLAKKGILAYLEKNLKGGEIVIIMGAGDIYDLTLLLTGHKIK